MHKDRKFAPKCIVLVISKQKHYIEFCIQVMAELWSMIGSCKHSGCQVIKAVCERVLNKQQTLQHSGI